MNKIRAFLLTLALLLLMPHESIASPGVVLKITCVDHSQLDRAIIHFGYYSASNVSGTGSIGPNDDIAIISYPPNDLSAGEHRDVFVVESYTENGIWQFVDGTTYQVYTLKFNRYTKGASCNGWKPSAPSINIPAGAANCPCTLEIQDAYGHWSLVTDSAHPEGIPVNNNDGNVELIGSVGQDTDPGHYRLIESKP